MQQQPAFVEGLEHCEIGSLSQLQSQPPSQPQGLCHRMERCANGAPEACSSDQHDEARLQPRMRVRECINSSFCAHNIFYNKRFWKMPYSVSSPLHLKPSKNFCLRKGSENSFAQFHQIVLRSTRQSTEVYQIPHTTQNSIARPRLVQLPDIGQTALFTLVYLLSDDRGSVKR